MALFRKDPAAAAGADQSNAAERAASAAAAAVTASMQQPDVNQAAIEQERAKYRRPKDDTRAFKVHARGVKRLRRAGVEFTGDPQIVNAEDITEAQAIELLNTPHLFVEELGTASKDAVKPNTQQVAGPAPDQLRAPGDAPVPAPDNSPGPRGTGAVVGGMTAVNEAGKQAHESPPRKESK